MMKLRNLNDDRERAMTILSKWSFAAPDYTFMDQFRLSATSIYPFQDGEDILLLRFSPEDERDSQFIESELDLISYLESNDFDVAERLPSKLGRTLETVEIDGRAYHASIFKRVKGQRVDRIDLTDDLLFKLGRTLAELHNLSEGYEPSNGIKKRPDYCSRLSWVKALLESDRAMGSADHNEAMDLLEYLEECLDKLLKTSQNFGLIHYDYDLDNLFYDEDSDAVSVIDFDDALYHWYYLDILNFEESLEDELDGEVLANAKKAFKSGYVSLRASDPNIEKQAELLMKYSALISYAVCLYSSSELANDPPEWMINLRSKLTGNMENKKQIFKVWLT